MAFHGGLVWRKTWCRGIFGTCGTPSNRGCIRLAVCADRREGKNVEPYFFLLIFCLVIPLGTGLIVTLVVWGLRRLSLRLGGFQSAIKIEGATCLKANDGSVIIRPPSGFYRTGALILMGLVGLIGVATPIVFLVWAVLMGRALLADTLRSVAVALAVGIALGGGLVAAVVRSPRQSSMRFNTHTRLLEISTGSEEPRRISFSSISQIAMSSKQIPFSDGTEMTVNDIWAILSDGQKLLLGSLSGAELRARTNTLTQWIADATGVAIQTSEPLSGPT